MSTRPLHPFPGSPQVPTGNGWVEGAGAASWADRADRPDLTLHGEPRIQPMSILEGFHVDAASPDPRGMTVTGAGRKAGAKVTDIWVDRSEPQVRYLQLELPDGSTALAPMGFCKVDNRRIHIVAMYAHQFAGIPRTKAADRITLLEEDRIVAYFAGGYRYADERRNEPLI
jgi:photosynthetic reaction center H subunit